MGPKSARLASWVQTTDEMVCVSYDGGSCLEPRFDCGIDLGSFRMESEVVESMKRFSLMEEEMVGIALEEVDVVKGVEESKLSLFGKLHGEKKANFTGFKNFLHGIWVTRKPFQVRELGLNFFQFVFQSEEDKTKVLNSRVWTFENQYILLKEWSEKIEVKEEDFSTVNLWVQIWNVPNHWISSETGLKIGKLFAGVKDLLIPEYGSIKGRYIKLLVTVNLNKPLLRGTFITLGDTKWWVDFRYENLIGACYYCGLIGHIERGCHSRKEDLQNSNLNEGQFGDWLKADESLFGYKRGGGNVDRSEFNHFVKVGRVGTSNVQASNEVNPKLHKGEHDKQTGEGSGKHIDVPCEMAVLEQMVENYADIADIGVEALKNKEPVIVPSEKDRAPLADITKASTDHLVGIGKFAEKRGIIGRSKRTLILKEKKSIHENKENLWDGGRMWNVNLIKQLFDQQVSEAIIQVPICWQQGCDRIYWMLTSNKKFSVHSAYQALCSRKMNLLDCCEGSTGAERRRNGWKKIWTLKIKGKLKHFIWKCFQNVLPVLSVLGKRGMKVDTKCVWCGEEEETIDHLLFHFFRARRVRKIAPVNWEGIYHSSLSVKDWWMTICSLPWDLTFIDRINLSTYILWWLWKTRNSWMFQNIRTLEVDLVSLVQGEWMEFDAIG
ncbi:hypothetical protein DH2020_049200 [Rehmannia glutinosa]|uniref:CCHC-type domain-containing protein n=1 Tax=Rehmannia glutinosa TaxID=99300 RepID=A0ABR0U478_REHGL